LKFITIPKTDCGIFPVNTKITGATKKEIIRKFSKYLLKLRPLCAELNGTKKECIHPNCYVHHIIERLCLRTLFNTLAYIKNQYIELELLPEYEDFKPIHRIKEEQGLSEELKLVIDSMILCYFNIPPEEFDREKKEFVSDFIDFKDTQYHKERIENMMLPVIGSKIAKNK